MKADKAMWIASFKARVLENSELNNNGSEFQYVECLYPATKLPFVPFTSSVLVGYKQTELALCQRIRV